MDSGNLVLLILGIGLIALIAYLIYKTRAVKGQFQVGPVSAELESDKAIETAAKPTPNPTTMPAADYFHLMTSVRMCQKLRVFIWINSNGWVAPYPFSILCVALG